MFLFALSSLIIINKLISSMTAMEFSSFIAQSAAAAFAIAVLLFNIKIFLVSLFRLSFIFVVKALRSVYAKTVVWMRLYVQMRLLIIVLSSLDSNNSRESEREKKCWIFRFNHLKWIRNF